MGDVFQLSEALGEEEICNSNSTIIVRCNENEDKSIYKESEMIDICMEGAEEENKQCDSEKLKDGSAATNAIVEDVEYCVSVNGLDESQKVSNDQIQIPDELMIHNKAPHVENLSEIEIESMQGGSITLEKTEFGDISISPRSLRGDKVNQLDTDLEVHQEMAVDPCETNGHHQVGNRKENGSDLTGAHQKDPDILINSCVSNDLVNIEQGQIIIESEEEKDTEMKSGGEDELQLQLVVIQADIESSIAENQGLSSSINTDTYNVGEICMIGNDSEVKSVSVACEEMTLVPLEEEDRQVKKCDPEKGEDGSSNSDFLIENGEHCVSASGLDKSQKTTYERVPEYKILIKTPLVENINEIENVSTERVGSVDIDTSGKVDLCNLDPVVLRGEKFEIDQDMGGLRKIVDRKVLDNLNKECVNQEDSCHSIYSNIDYIPE